MVIIAIKSRTCSASASGEKHNKARRYILGRINRPIREIYFHLNYYFCAARKETRWQKVASYFYGLFYKSAKIFFIVNVHK